LKIKKSKGSEHSADLSSEADLSVDEKTSSENRTNQLKFNLNENIFNSKSNPADDEIKPHDSRNDFNSSKSVSKSDSESNVNIDLTETERYQFITPKKYLNSIIIVVKARRKNLSLKKQ